MAKSKGKKSPADVVLDTINNDPIIGITENITPTITRTETPTEIILTGPSKTIDPVADVLGAGGEVTVTVANDKPNTNNGDGKFNLAGAIKHALNTNVDMTRDDVLTLIEDKYGKTMDTDFSNGVFTNSLSVIRKKLKTTDRAIAAETVEMVDVLKLCQSLKLTPTALTSTIQTISAVGSTDAILGALAKLQELQELLNGSKTV